MSAIETQFDPELTQDDQPKLELDDQTEFELAIYGIQL